MDGPDTELALDGADQRGALEQRAGERLEGARELRLAAGDLVVEADDAEVLLTGALLRLDEAGGAVDTGRESARASGAGEAEIRTRRSGSQ